MNLDLQIIQDEVEREFNFKLDFDTRHRPQVYARSIAFVMAKQYTENSLKKIGKFFGNKNHATVLHGIRKSENEYVLLPQYRSKLLKITHRLSDFFPGCKKAKGLRKDANDYTEAIKEIEHYKKLYSDQLRENQRLENIIISRKINNLDLLVCHLEPNEIKELTQHRVIPYLKMRGKYKELKDRL